MPKKSFHVLYTDECSLKIQSFDSKEKRKDFINEFLLKYQDCEDYCIDLVFNGSLKYVETSIKTGRSLD